jgi:hypothetical protein
MALCSPTKSQFRPGLPSLNQLVVSTSPGAGRILVLRDGSFAPASPSEQILPAQPRETARERSRAVWATGQPRGMADVPRHCLRFSALVALLMSARQRAARGPRAARSGSPPGSPGREPPESGQQPGQRRVARGQQDRQQRKTFSAELYSAGIALRSSLTSASALPVLMYATRLSIML